MTAAVTATAGESTAPRTRCRFMDHQDQAMQQCLLLRATVNAASTPTRQCDMKDGVRLAM